MKATNAAKLGERIKFFRNKAGITQAKLCELIDKSNTHLTQIERGLSLPSVPMLYDISQALHVPIDCFFMDDDKMYAEYAALKMSKALDDIEKERLVSYVEIQQSIHGVIMDTEKPIILWDKSDEHNKK